MFNVKRLFGFLATGEIPERTALDEAIEREEARRGVSDELMDEMLAFLRGGSPASSVRRSPLSAEAQDAAPASLEEHDEQYHPEGYREGDSCKFRDERAKGDRADSEVEKVGGGGQRTAKPSSLSNRKRKEWGGLMRRKHPEIDADRLLEELGKIEDRKIQGDAFRWVMKGAVILPDGLPRIVIARSMADKAKADPLKYNTPQACIDALSGKVTLKEKPIDPDTVPELTDKKTFPMGVTTYEVQDDINGQLVMRRIIDTHWGKDANPWCLLSGDGNGNLSDGEGGRFNAFHYWNHYNALPKRVAFKDGKLLAFMATDNGNLPRDEYGYEKIYVDYDDIADSVIVNRDEYEYLLDEFEEQRDRQHGYEYSEFDAWLRDEHHDLYEEFYELKKDKLGAENAEEQWWDRQNASHEGIPLGNIPVPGDAFGRWADFEIRDGEMKQISVYKKGEPNKPGFKSWYVNGQLAVEVDEDGRQTVWNEDGSLVA